MDGWIHGRNYYILYIHLNLFHNQRVLGFDIDLHKYVLSISD